MNRKYRSVLVFAFGLLLSVTSFARDESRPVDRSELTGVKLPNGAQVVEPGSVPAEIKQTMAAIVAEGKGKLRQGESEVLIWTGNDLKSVGAKAVVSRLSSSLTASGWEYEVSGTENGVTIFSALRSQPQRRAILGFYAEADGTLMFAWTEVHAADSSSPITSTVNDTAGGSVSDYTFTTPNGWSRSDSANKISLVSSDGQKSVTFLPTMDSSGNLERDASTIIWKVLKGFKAWSGNGFELDYGVFEKGRTAQGLEYFKVYRYATPTSDNEEFSDGRIDAVLLLVKLGDKVAVVLGRGPFQSDYARDSPGTAIDLILYDLKFKSVTSPYDLKRDLVGSWATASSTVAIAYTFNANGTFNKGGAISFRTSHDATRDKVTTTSYGMTDRYSLSGNVITQTYKQTGQVYKYKVRAYDTKYNKDAWQQRLGFLPVEDPDSGTIVFTRSR